MAFRDGPFENIKVPLAWTAAVMAVIGLVLAVLLMFSDRREARANGANAPVRAGFDTAFAPVAGVLSAPVRFAGSLSDGVKGYFFAVSENRRLRAELAELQPWRDQAIALKNVNARYEIMLGLRTEPAVAMVTARSISDSRGPYVNARLLDSGAAKGIRIGNPVINEHGLVGRVAGTSGGVSRMLQVTDVASRIPVLIDRSDARAVLTGDGSANPRLEYSIQGAGAIQAGDRVLTSGDGGGLPRGLPVGVAAKGIDGTWRVKLFSDRGAIDYVRVLLFQDFGQLVNPDSLNAPPLAGLGTARSPDAQQSAAIADATTRRATAAAAERARIDRANAAPLPVPPTTAGPAQAGPTQAGTGTGGPAPVVPMGQGGGPG